MLHQGYLFAFSCVVLCVSCSEINDIGINSFAASRSLLAVGAVPAPNKNRTGTLYKIDNCTLVYTRGLSLKFFDGKNDELYNFDNDEPKVSGKCNNSAKGPSESVLNVNYTGLKGNITEFKMKMVFIATNYGQWKLQNLSVSLTCGKNVKNCSGLNDMPFDASYIASERRFSYHCYRPQPIVAIPKNASNFYLSFNKLQVQPFNVANNRFSHADDCIGFFSSGIWSGLFVTLILTLIFAYGIIMLNNINVTDRFDDPKGPGIQVNVQE